MYFEQFYLACLSHASYMIGSEGIAAVVDPQRDVELYLEEARQHGFRIAHVIETHLHADFVSGHRELAERTGAHIYLGARAGANFLHAAVRDGDEIRFGACRLQFLETPGHTLESISVLVTDFERGPEPFAALTGDTLFVGDVGRPDLSPDHSPQQLAGMLYDSLQKLMKLPAGVEVYPAHGAGSLCGRNMSAERHSTIGKERAGNAALQVAGREQFIRELTAELPERPGYFARDAEINREGAPPLAELPPLEPLAPAAVAEMQRNGVTVLDTRPAAAFGEGHIPGALNIALAGQYALWAGTLMGVESQVVLVAENAEKASEGRTRLARVGLERVCGYLDGGMEAWRRAGMPAPQLRQVGVEQLTADLQIVDVRRPPEWRQGYIEGAALRSLDHLRDSLGGLDPRRPTAVYCKSGYRSAIAASLLQAAGFADVRNIVGGFDAWQAANRKVSHA